MPVGTAGVVNVGTAVLFVVGATGSPVPLAECTFALTASIARRKNTSTLVRRDETAIVNWSVGWFVIQVIKGRYRRRLYRKVATRGKTVRYIAQEDKRGM